MARTILITGGSGLVGRNLVSHFINNGDKVIFTTRSKSSLESILSTNTENANNLYGFSVDLTEDGAIESLVQQLKNKKLLIDCLVNNARCSKFLQVQSNGLISRQNFLAEYLLDVIVPYELTMTITNSINTLRKVVNIGSQYGFSAVNPALYTGDSIGTPIHYSVAKSALEHLTRELSVHLAERDISVNCVAFGGIEGRANEDFKQRYSLMNPMHRMLREDEISGPVDFLLSNSCSGMTGHTLRVDNGWTIW